MPVKSSQRPSKVKTSRVDPDTFNRNIADHNNQV